jgi:hypothetical protein
VCKTQFEFRSHFFGKKSASYRLGNVVLKICVVTECVFLIASGKCVAIHFLVYLFIRFAHISYRWFMDIRYKFKRSTYILEQLVVGEVEYRDRLKQENG